jgi:hypothetical protein
MQLFITILVACLLVGSYAQRLRLQIKDRKIWIMPEDEFRPILNLALRGRSREITKHLKPQGNKWSRVLRKICDHRRDRKQINDLMSDYKARSQEAIRSGSKINMKDVVHGMLVGSAFGTLFWWGNPHSLPTAATIIVGMGGVIYFVLSIWTARRRSIKEWKRSEEQIQRIANVCKSHKAGE